VAPSKTAPASSMNISLTLDADRALLGTLALDRISGRARITARDATLEPIRFGVFGGRYDGTLALTLSQIPEFKLGASLSEVDVAEATRFAGSPDSITGRLGGRIDVTGRGTTADSVLKSVHGQARVDVRNGTIKGLGLVKTIVLAGSGRADAKAHLANETTTDSFTQLVATLTIANGTATTQDLRFESKDVLLSGSGSFRLDGSAVNLVSRVQLSDELSKQAGQDLVRYTQEQGRVTLPATVTGSVGNFHVRLDMADVAKRAITNRATEEAKKAIDKGLGGLLRGR
jgi:AsmA protein